jgi:hypothetical protein
MKIVDLRAIAAAEAVRLASARALLRHDDAGAVGRLEGDAAWIAFTDRARTRVALRRRMCCVWRITLEDGSGKSIESRLVSALVDLPPGATARLIRSLIVNIEAAIRPAIDDAADEWAAAAVRSTLAFNETRTRRNQEIDAARQPLRSPSQAGLFDRRSERARNALAAARDEAERSLRDRARATISGDTVVRRPARLLLVLVPSR